MNYGLKYTVPFRTISEIPCVVNIEVKGYAGAVRELIGGGTPFVIETDTGDLMTPMRSSSATLSVYGSDYLQDLYTSDPQGIKITLLKNNTVERLGFVTQDTFSQNFSNPEFIYEIECVSAISTLKQRKFKKTAGLISFADLIIEGVRASMGGYTDIILSGATTTSNPNLFSHLKIASANFFDELGEAMSYYEIFEEIAKYTGCTFTVYKNKVFLIDYLAISKGVNTYWRYTLVDGAFTAVVNEEALSHDTTAQALGYRGTGAAISRLAGKNKIAVNCSLYEFDKIFPDVEDCLEAWGWGTYDEKSFRRSYRKNPPPIHTTVSVGVSLKEGMLKTYKYRFVNGAPELVTDSFSDVFSSILKISRYTSDNIPLKLNFDTELVVLNYKTFEDVKKGNILKRFPIMTMRSGKEILVHDKVYFCFSCQWMANADDGPQCAYGGWINTDPALPAQKDTNRMLPLKLKIGDYFYNGTAWTKTESIFYVPIEIKKGANMTGQFHSVKNTNNYKLGLGGISGFVISPPHKPIFGECELTMYNIYDSGFISVTPFSFGLRYSFFKSIKLEAAVQDLDSVYNVSKGKEDVVFERVIAKEYTEQADDIDLKICTAPKGKLALSSVLTDSGLLDKVSWGGMTDIAEHLLTYKAMQLYGKPRLNINPMLANSALPYSVLTDVFLTGSKFIVAGGEDDVKMEAATYNLIEA